MVEKYNIKLNSDTYLDVTYSQFCYLVLDFHIFDFKQRK